jgi:penicillin-binding protein 1B
MAERISRRRKALGLLGLAVVLALAALTAYLVYLDRTITTTFEGRRWTEPAVIYARPLELHPGAALTTAEVIAELDRLGYALQPSPPKPGAYHRSGDELDVYLRAFDFPNGSRDAQRITLKFSAGSLARVQDALGRPVPLIRLDPVTIGSFFPSHGEDRLVLPPERVPDLLRETLKVVEDRNFDRHAGFDLRAIARAFWVNVTAGEVRQGGSTLTQQLVKSYFLDNRRTIGRKLRELAMAIILDARFGKEDLLNAYVNEIYLGQDGRRAVHGFGLGAQFYFNRPLTELDIQQLALLIAVIRGPSYYDPFRHPERARARRDLVLDKMLQGGLVDEDQHARAVRSPLTTVAGTRRGGAYYPAFLDLVRANLTALDRDALTTRGLAVFTTLEPQTQDDLEQAVAQALGDLESSRGLEPGSLQAAAVMTATQTGEVLALSGARSAGSDGFNRALNARRPVGSLLKPVVYLAALEQGLHLASLVDDAPVVLPLAGGTTWQPENFDHVTHGEVPMIRALAESLNLATVNLGLEVGVGTVAARFETLIGRPPANTYPSLLLGAEAMTPVEVSALYGIFASGGFYQPPKAVISVLDESRSPTLRRPLTLEQRIDTKTARALDRALQVVMARGTGRSSRFARVGVAGKTGTSDDYRDSWFAGYDDAALTVVWVGRDDNAPTGMTGASGALKVWDRIMADRDVIAIPPDPDSRKVDVEFATGLVANPLCADVVTIPVPEGAALQEKPGCGIKPPSLGERIRNWLRND